MPCQVCGAPVESAYTAFTASHLLIVTDDGEKRYGDEPTLIVAVVPVDVQVEVFVAVFVGDGLGVAVLRGADVWARVGVAVGLDAVVATAWRFFTAAWVGPVGEAEAGVLAADVVGIGGGAEPCTSTFADPLVHAVSTSMRPIPAAIFPLVAMPA